MSDTIDLEAVPEHYVWHHIARPHPTKYEEEPSVATLRKILEEFIEVSAQFFDFFVRGDREDDEKDPLNALLDEQPRKTSTVYQPEWFEMVALIMSQIAIRTLIDKYDDPDEEAGVVNVDSSPVSPERKEPDELLEPIFHDKVFQSHPLMRDMEAIDPRMSEEMRRDRDDFKNEIIDAFVKEGVQGLKKLLRKPAYSYQRCMRHVESFVRITWKCVENPDEERGVEGLSQRAGVGRPWLVKGLDLHTMGRMQMVSSAFFTSYEDLKKRAEDGAKKYKLVGRAPPKERRTSAGNGNLGQARRVLIKDGDGDDDDDFQPGLKKKPKAKPKPKESTAQELPPVNQRPGLVGALNASAKNGGSKAEALPPKQTKVVSPAISPVKPLPQQAPPLPRRPAPPTQGWKMAHDKVPYLPLNDKGVVSQPVKQLGSPKKGLTHNVNSFMKQRESRKDEIDDEIIVSGDEDFATYGSAKKEKPKPQGTKIIPVDADVGSDDLLVYGEEKRGRENSPDKRGGTSSDSPKPKRRRVGG